MLFLPIARREPIVRRAPLLVAVASLFGFLFGMHDTTSGGVYIAPDGRIGIGGGVSRDVFEAYPSIMLATGLALAIVAARVLPLRVRVHTHESSLPLSPGRIRVERLLGFWATLVVMVLTAWLVHALARSDGLVEALPTLGGAQLSTALFVLFLAGYRPRIRRLDKMEAAILAWGAASAALYLGARAAEGAALPFVVLAAAAAWAASSHFTLDKRESADTPPLSAAEAGTALDDGAVRLVGATNWVLLRFALTSPSALFGCLLLLLATERPAVVLTGPYVYFVLVMGLAKTRGLETLSISRARQFCTVAVVPCLVVMAVYLLFSGAGAVDSASIGIEAGAAAGPWASLMSAILVCLLGCAAARANLWEWAGDRLDDPRRIHFNWLSTVLLLACLLVADMTATPWRLGGVISSAAQSIDSLVGGSWLAWTLLLATVVWTAGYTLTRGLGPIETDPLHVDVLRRRGKVWS